jgi:hypothetical protein
MPKPTLDQAIHFFTCWEHEIVHYRPLCYTGIVAVPKLSVFMSLLRELSLLAQPSLSYSRPIREEEQNAIDELTNTAGESLSEYEVDDVYFTREEKESRHQQLPQAAGYFCAIDDDNFSLDPVFSPCIL